MSRTAADRPTIALRCYRLLLRTTPHAVRRTYGPELDAAFLEMRREPRYQTAGGATRFWIDIVRDLARARMRLRRPPDEDDRFDELTDTPLAGLAHPVVLHPAPVASADAVARRGESPTDRSPGKAPSPR